jgi:hypothetical protein
VVSPDRTGIRKTLTHKWAFGTILFSMMARNMTLARVSAWQDPLTEVATETGLRDNVARLNVFGEVGGDPGEVGADGTLVDGLALIVYQPAHVLFDEVPHL